MCKIHAECQFEVLTYIPMKQIYQQDMKVKGVTYEHEFHSRNPLKAIVPVQVSPQKVDPADLVKKGTH